MLIQENLGNVLKNENIYNAPKGIGNTYILIYHATLKLDSIIHEYLKQELSS